MSSFHFIIIFVVIIGIQYVLENISMSMYINMNIYFFFFLNKNVRLS